MYPCHWCSLKCRCRNYKANSHPYRESKYPDDTWWTLRPALVSKSGALGKNRGHICQFTLCSLNTAFLLSFFMFSLALSSLTNIFLFLFPSSPHPYISSPTICTRLFKAYCVKTWLGEQAHLSDKIAKQSKAKGDHHMVTLLCFSLQISVSSVLTKCIKSSTLTPYSRTTTTSAS